MALLGLICFGAPSLGLAAPSWHLEPAPEDNETVAGDASGLKLRRFLAYRLPDRKERFNLVWAVMPAAVYRTRVQVVNSSGILSGLAQCRGDIAITGGFSEDLKSNGWVVSDGKVVSPPADLRYGGAFIDTDDGPRIIRKAEFDQYQAVKQALQSSPILIFDSKFDGATETVDSWNRAGIGVTTDGGVIIALVYGPKNSLADFGRLIVDLSEGGHSPKIVAMIGLDSRVTGAIRVRKGNRHFGSEGDVFTPNIICFERQGADR